MDTTAQNTTTQNTTTQNTAGSTSDPAAGPEPTTGPDAGTATGTTPPRTDGAAGTATPGVGERLASFRLRRSATDKMLAGVCGGLAADLGADPALLRILFLVATLATGGAAALIYLAIWLIAPVG